MLTVGYQHRRGLPTRGCGLLKGWLWSHVHVTQRPRRRLHAVVNLYGSTSGFSERTNHSPCGCGASTEGLQFLGGARQALGGGRKEGPQGRKGSVTPPRNSLLRERGTIISP